MGIFLPFSYNWIPIISVGQHRSLTNPTWGHESGHGLAKNHNTLSVELFNRFPWRKPLTVQHLLTVQSTNSLPNDAFLLCLSAPISVSSFNPFQYVLFKYLFFTLSLSQFYFRFWFRVFAGFVRISVCDQGFCSSPSLSIIDNHPLYWKATNPTLSPSHLQGKSQQQFLFYEI